MSSFRPSGNKAMVGYPRTTPELSQMTVSGMEALFIVGLFIVPVCFSWWSKFYRSDLQVGSFISLLWWLVMSNIFQQWEQGYGQFTVYEPSFAATSPELKTSSRLIVGTYLVRDASIQSSSYVDEWSSSRKKNNSNFNEQSNLYLGISWRYLRTSCETS